MNSLALSVKFYLTRIVAILVCYFSSLSHAGSLDSNWEKQVAEKLETSAEATEIEYLTVNGRSFLGLYTELSGDVASGAVIVLHGMGGHADWPKTISPLRLALPKQGWSTLSIQLPLLAIETPIENYGKTLDAASARIDAAVSFLRSRKFHNIVIVGHSFGAASALHYLSRQQDRKVQAVVVISLQEYPFLKPPINTLKLIEKIQIPLLDIYGSRDYRKVIEQAPDRRLAAKKANNRLYTQFEIEAADHYFSKLEDVLARRIRGWLDKVAPAVSIKTSEELDSSNPDDEQEDVVE